MRPVTFGSLLLIASAFTVSGCRMRQTSSSQIPAKNEQSFKLLATCVSESPNAKVKSIVVQEELTNLRGLLFLDNGGKTIESQSVLATSLTIETRENTEIRKTFQAENMTLTIDLERKGADTFSGRLTDLKDKNESSFTCAI